jgi:hypothetical protein
MNTEVAQRTETPAALLEKVVVGGDLSKLLPAERLSYYADVCKSVGLNPLTRPFEYITLNNKLTLYARRDATDQLRALKGISIQIVGRDLLGDIYIVTARASMPGREDESTGAINILGLKGEALANAYMKAETKAKRRVTLSIAGLGLLDETELDDATDGPDLVQPGEPRAVIAMPKPKSEPKAEEPGQAEKALANQLGFIRKKLTDKVTEAAICAQFNVEKLEDIAKGEVNRVLTWIGEQA